MADIENQNSSASANSSSSPQAQSTAKKEKKVKNPRSKPSHPPTSEMVNNAIKGLKERGGSSLQAIKKYIAANYKADAEKVAPFIKKYLKSAVASGSLVQTKGKGASGSFKLASASSGSAKPSATEKKTSGTAVRRPKKPPVKRVAGEKAKTGKKAAASPKGKKASPEKKAAAAAKPKKVTAEDKKTVASKVSSATSASKTKSPSKAKKTNKGPTKKPKAPKPKTAKATPASASSPKAKKAASPKKKK
ncbi:histone H1-like [Leptinotarsa decemlineata]|uniref:histone H1-like n=1 Tax=Leptinotarsa decemlineata TaxID=7539 RepID=UPI003D30C85B